MIGWKGRTSSILVSKAVGYKRKWSFCFRAIHTSERYLSVSLLNQKLSRIKEKRASFLGVWDQSKTPDERYRLLEKTFLFSFHAELSYASKQRTSFTRRKRRSKHVKIPDIIYALRPPVLALSCPAAVCSSGNRAPACTFQPIHELFTASYLLI